MIVYKLTNRNNGKVYIGQTVRTLEARWNAHLRDAKNRKPKDAMVITRAIQKHGPEAFSVETIAECSDQECLDYFEEHLIQEHDSTDPSKGYNNASKAKGAGRWSEATKKKISGSLKGKRHSKEHRRKISEAKKGKAPWNKGKKTPEETKEKLRQAARRRNRK